MRFFRPFWPSHPFDSNPLNKIAFCPKMTNNIFFSFVLLLLGTTIPSLLPAQAFSSNSMNQIRAISFDITGTLVTTREPVIQSYYDAALWSRLPNPPSQSDLKSAFKIAFKERCIESPCFGGVEGISGREWWRQTVRRVLEHASTTTKESYSDDDFDRYFRRVYQHFGSPKGYKVLEDANELVKSLVQEQLESEITITDGRGKEEGKILLGITSNTPTRHMESVLPMLDCFHDAFKWFSCSQDVGYEKPSREIFDDAYRQAQFWMPDIKREQILHIGDSLACDYCGARASGFQALWLDRSEQNIPRYQDWIEAPDYPGKSEEDIQQHTIKSLLDVKIYLA